MSTITRTAAAVTCTGLGERHTDSIVYQAAPYGEVRLSWRSTGEGDELVTGSFDFEHIVHCTRHTPLPHSSRPAEFYVSVQQAEAGIRLDGVPLLEHPGYRLAAARLAARLAPLPVLDCPEGVDSIRFLPDRRITVGGQIVGRGKYRLDYGDGIIRTMSV